jgi:hypothetical protein
MRTTDNTYLPPITGTVEPQDDAPVVDDAPTAVFVIGTIIMVILAVVLVMAVL